MLLMGGGGHAKVLLDTLKLSGAQVLGVVDSNPKLKGQRLLEVEIIGGEDILDQFPGDQVLLVNGIGSVQQPGNRKALYERFVELGYEFASVTHPSSVIAKDVKLGRGVQIMAGAVIQPGCSIDSNTIVNTRAVIDHDCVLGAHVHIAPGVTISGNVKVGKQTHIGTGANIIQGVNIGENSLIGAGSLVTSNLPSGVVAYGVPAKVVS